MPVRYCLGINHADVAGAVGPRDTPFSLAPLRQALQKIIGDQTLGQMRVPSFAWSNERLKTHILIQLDFAGVDQARSFEKALASRLTQTPRIYGFGPDPYVFPLDAWSPFGPTGGVFNNRDDAEHLTSMTSLADGRGTPVTGKGVNVVIIDRGLSRSAVQGLANRMAARRGLQRSSHQRELGWTCYAPPNTPRTGPKNPGQTGSEHGHMIARNVLAVAPDATIWDAPLLSPDDQPDGPPGPSSACHLFHLIRTAVRNGTVTSWDFEAQKQVTVPFTRPVVLANAWGVMDPESRNDYSSFADDPNNQLVNDMVLLERAGIDVVFAAGNCGEPTPDSRCGQDERGPGCGIYGMNGHPSVLSVGAVRTDGVPLAFSAQGPGRLAPAFRKENSPLTSEAFHKPDLCAPSHFREPDDAAEVNTGTSASCGFAAGIVAALRSVKAGRHLRPAWLRALLRETAQPAGADGWDPRLGYGIINGANALAMIER